MARSLFRSLIIIWLMISALIGTAVLGGHELPAGDEILYTNPADMNPFGSVNVFLRDMTRNLDQRLTHDYRINTFATWSPDGQHIAYFWMNGNLSNVYIMDAWGQNKRRLGLEFTTLYSGYFWSPDGQWILLTVTSKGVQRTIVIRVVTGEIHTLPQAISLGRWSPDSQTIIYHMVGENSVTHWYGLPIVCLAQSQSCKSIELDLFKQKSDIKPVWSPNGQAITYRQFDGTDSKIIVIRLRCADLTAACIERYETVGATPYSQDPIWSPDGRQLAFAVSQTEVHVVTLESGKTRTYTLLNGIFALQDWSPDGRYIIFYGGQSGVNQIFLLDTVSGKSTVLYGNIITVDAPQWRPRPH
jgi:Tol biopolymer transport system component